MPIGVAEAVAVVRLTWEAFLQLAGFANGRLRSMAIERELDRAWRELLKGDAADMGVVEAALANARAAGPLSPSAARLGAVASKIEGRAREPAARKSAPKVRKAAQTRPRSGSRPPRGGRRTK